MLERSDASGVLDAITRLSCEIGVPNFLLCDQGSNVIKALREADVSMKNLQLQLYTEKGIKFDVCSVGGHNEHGLVGRVIRTLQDSMEVAGIKTSKLTTLGLQTLCKLVENDHNNIPLGFKFDRDQDNTDVLKLITRNMLRVGRSNTRALAGPLRLPVGASELVDKVAKLYDAWFRIWSDSYVPKLLFRPKWFNDDTDLQLGDIVYFQKSDSDPDTSWIVGRISGIDRSRDMRIRKVKIKYRNAVENFDRETDRNVRKLVKLWSEDQWNLQDDLAALQDKLQFVSEKNAVVRYVESAFLGVCNSGDMYSGMHHTSSHGPTGSSQTVLDSCCCVSHCKLVHKPGGPLHVYKALTSRVHVASFALPLPW